MTKQSLFSGKDCFAPLAMTHGYPTAHMVGDHEILFAPFRLDCDNQQLWRDEQPLVLQPKPLAVLQYLAQHAGRLIAKEELLQQVWAGTHVTPKSLTVCIHAIRATLGDSEATPQFIETQGKQGYRFIVPLASTPPVVSSSQFSVASPDQAGAQIPHLAPGNGQLTPHLVGREGELAQLQEWYAAACAGTCTLGFVSGEAGIGKTALVNQFVASLRTMGQTWIGVGQGVQHHGTGEAYLPVMAVLSQFARGAEQGEVRAILQHYAPNWLVRLPALRQEGENNPPAAPLPVVTPQRLLWELGEAFRVLTERRSIVLVFDDLHWSDTATVDWLAYLARWQEPLRLLIIGTYRPADVIASGHPLLTIIQELRGKGQSAELRLELLSKPQVHDYCTQRFAGSALPPRLITLLHRRTDGHPLFLVRLLEYLVQQGFLTLTEGQWQLAKPVSELEGALPHELQEMIAQQVEQLSADEQRVLDVASVVGDAFASEVVAVGVALRAEQVEAECDELVRKEQVIEGRGVDEWPDGTITACYGFLHALFREVVYRRLGEGRRIRLHRAIADRLEVGYGARAVEIAGALAVHCAQGRDYYKGAKYHRYAASNALRLSAYQEALTHCQQGLGLLAHVPATPERDRQELALQVTLGVPLQATKGFAAPEVERAYARARELCQQVGETSQLFPVLWGLWAFYLVRAENEAARGLGEQLLTVAQSVRDPAFLLQAHYSLGATLVNVGKLTLAREHLEQSLVFYDPQQHRIQAFLYGAFDLKVAALSFASLVLWLLGYPDQAWNRSQEALVLAQELSHPFSLALALDFATRLHQFRREGQAAQERAEADITLSTEHGFPVWVEQGAILQGWALAEQGQIEEGIAQIRQGISAQRAGGTRVTLPYYVSLLAEAYGEAGRVAEGLDALAEALTVADKTGERYYEAELYRLKGELTLAQFSVQSLESRVQTNQKAKACPACASAAGTGKPSRRGKRQKSKITGPRFLTPNPHAEAEACFLKAIEIARRQEAKSLELRAVMSLARLWQTQGKKNEAHHVLAEIYHWFTEGFDTQDLQAAKALLDELG